MYDPGKLAHNRFRQYHEAESLNFRLRATISFPSSAVAEPRSPTSSKPIFRGYIAELDGLRAIGMTLVILHHMWPWQNEASTFLLWLQLPWMLMDGFFVLSGFLITGILLDSKNKSDYYTSFYARRSFRILPIYYVTLLLITVPMMLSGGKAYHEMLAHWGSPAWFFFYLGNMPTAISGKWPLAGNGVFQPLWSLQIEEQFYLLFPLLVHRFNTRTLTRILFAACCVSVGLRIALYFHDPSNELIQYVLLPCHWEGLALGAWLAIRFRQGPWIMDKRKLSISVLAWGAISVGTAIWGGYSYTAPFNRTIGFLLGSIWFAYIVLWLIQFRGSPKTAFMRSTPIRYLGKISYSAYLFHWPVGNALSLAATHLRAPQIDQGFVRLFLIYALTFSCSALSWHFFENPLGKLKERWFPSAATRDALRPGSPAADARA